MQKNDLLIKGSKSGKRNLTYTGGKKMHVLAGCGLWKKENTTAAKASTKSTKNQGDATNLHK